MDYQPTAPETHAIRACRIWTRESEADIRYPQGESTWAHVVQGEEQVPGLVVSAGLEARIRTAICLGREFRSRREGALKEAASVGQRKIDAESWRKSVEFRIELKKKEMETHGVTEARTEELEELWSEESRNENARKATALDDSKTRGDIEEGFRRWTHAWLEVDAVLDPVWTNAKILRP
jgi:hypothetical protein